MGLDMQIKHMNSRRSFVTGFLLVACSALATGQPLAAATSKAEFQNDNATAIAAESTQSQHAILSLKSPLNYQVFQQHSRTQGTIRISGGLDADSREVQFSISGKALAGERSLGWQPVRVDSQAHTFYAEVVVPAGGWYRLEVRAVKGAMNLGTRTVAHVGVGELFVVAGQSNSSNHGSERQAPQSGMVAAFDGAQWQVANDPQPGGSGRGGSFLPALGDALAAKLGVPIGVVCVGVGSTSVREWLPKGERMTNQPTTGRHVRAIGPHEWEATGELFDRLQNRLAALGPQGCRALLWHQGESDAGQARGGCPADRQISGEQYAKFMQKLIQSTRAQAGWPIPWLVAQATYHSELDPADEEFRAAQAGLWRAGLAIEGPDTDALRGEYRAGVHFNAKGLRQHGERWAEKIVSWLNHE